ncbi:glycosyltransferase [Nocardia transvalensis]|uniref:glycosyltransferase n=1 Tax=Nocardia transvalensis TaxID=37333 RepID=UPI0018932BB6|nr:glycosyltransferase [Nocardia transvalensis]
MATVHGSVDGEHAEYYRALGDSAHLVAISARQRELAPDLNWTATVRNAIDPDEWPFESRKQSWAMFLGRYAYFKGAHTALDAAHEAGLRLVLAAKCNEPLERHYFDNHVRPRLTRRDFVFGEADAVAKRLLLSQARCLLFPIEWEEPFEIAMIEAMACGTGGGTARRCGCRNHRGRSYGIHLRPARPTPRRPARRGHTGPTPMSPPGGGPVLHQPIRSRIRGGISTNPHRTPRHFDCPGPTTRSTPAHGRTSRPDRNSAVTRPGSTIACPMA